MPETLQEAKQLLRSVAPEEMEPLGEGYAGSEQRRNYGGVEQRWLVVFSQQAYEREMATLQRRLARHREAAARELRGLGRQRFACQADARAAVAEAERGWRYHRAQVEIEPLRKYRRRGRPRTGEEPQIVGYRVRGEAVGEEGAIAEATRSKGRFIVATHERDAGRLPAGELLAAYKARGVSVERGFRFLKDPLFFAESLFLKRPQRLMALLMVMGLALLIYALAERKVRRALQERGETIPNQLGKPVQQPTLRRIFPVFEGIDVLLLVEGGGVRERRLLNLRAIHRKILDLLGPEVKKCYLLN